MNMTARTTRTAGVWLGLVTLCLLIFIWKTTHIDFSKAPANEFVAVGSLRTIYSANSSYASDHPEQGYAKNLSDLSMSPMDTKHNEEHEGLIDTTLASGVKSGYKFIYIPRSSIGTGRLDRYEIYADPLRTGKSGKRHFFVDESGVIRWSETGSASAESPTLQ